MPNAKLLKLPTASHQHRHEHHQVVVGVQGEVDLFVDGNASHIDAWRACLVPTDARHDYSGDQRNHVLVIDVDPYVPSVGSHAHSHYQRLKPLFRQSSTLRLDNRLQGLVQFAADEFNRAPENSSLHQHLAGTILHCLAQRLAEAPRQPAPLRNTINPDTVRRFLLENLHRNIGVQDMAAVSCLSVSRFHDLFRQSTGTTPHQFLLQTRIEQASQLLERTSLSVSEISHRTGFSSQSALANALKKYRGTTASALRSRS
jgi:AraC-like DNA-binding protein